MKITFTLLFTLLTFAVSAQRLKYLDINMQEVEKEQAVLYTETTYKDRLALIGTVKTFFMDGTPFSEVNYSSLYSKRRDGLTTFYYPNGNIKTQIFFKDDLFDGPLKTYYPNQRTKRAELYEKGKFVQGKCFTPAGKDTTHYAFQTEPQFPGGQAALEAFIKKNLPKGYYAPKDYRPSALVKFSVQRNGEISSTISTESPYKYQDALLTKMVKAMPAWIPGTDDGVAAEKEVVIPIIFN